MINLVDTAKKQVTKGSKYYQNPYGAGKAFDAEQVKRARSKFFRNFHRTKSKAYMTTFDDVQFLNIIKFSLCDILGGGDPETTFDLIIDLAWEQGAKTGNIKDRVDAQEASFKEWLKGWVLIAWDVAAQKMIRPFLAAVTESSTTTTASNALAIWVQSDWDNFILSLEKLDCPDFVYRFMKAFLYVIRLTEPYERAGIEIPPSYLIYIEHTHNYADLCAHREVVKTESSNAMTHCRKFGIPFSKFSASKLEAIEVTKDQMWDNQDILALFNIMFMYFYDNTPVSKILMQNNNTIYTAANTTTDFTNVVYAFIDGKEMSIIHALYPAFALSIVNNPRGELFQTKSPNNAEYEVPIRMMKLLGTTWDYGMITTGSVDDAYRILCLLASYYSSDATGALYWTGTKVTANQPNNYTRWVWFQVRPNIMVGTGVSYQEQLDSIDNAFRYMLYGE